MELIKLRRVENSNHSLTMVALKLTKRESEDTSSIINKLYSSYDEKISSFEIGYSGDLNLVKHPVYSLLVRKIKEGTKNNRPSYRNYAVSLEQQMKTMMFVNVCEDAETSWNTVKTSLGARNSKSEVFGAIIEIKYIK